MGIPTILDAAVIAPAAVLGLLGVWRGLVRSLVAWPMRWLLPLFGASVVASPAMLHLAMNGTLAELLRPSGTTVAAAAAGVSFLVMLLLLAMFMRNLKERVAAWTGQRRIGFVGRSLGGLLGIACGTLLAGIAVACTPMLRATDDAPAWVRESVLLPHFRGAADAVERALLPYLPHARGSPRTSDGRWTGTDAR